MKKMLKNKKTTRRYKPPKNNKKDYVAHIEKTLTFIICCFMAAGNMFLFGFLFMAWANSKITLLALLMAIQGLNVLLWSATYINEGAGKK